MIKKNLGFNCRVVWHDPRYLLSFVITVIFEPPGVCIHVCAVVFGAVVVRFISTPPGT